MELVFLQIDFGALADRRGSGRRAKRWGSITRDVNATSHVHPEGDPVRAPLVPASVALGW
jgi:hypothetical protein